MRLLNTWTFEIKEFLNDEWPYYAILSHTWGKEEVSYKDWIVSTGTPPKEFNETEPWLSPRQPSISEPAFSMRGFAKVTRWCEKARRAGFAWVWMDTCCIDKSSSTELSEAINSMFQWYASAAICFAYLSDVTSTEDLSTSDSDLWRSRWFERGWTLQELLAPPEVVFLDSDWEEIGTRRSLSNIVSSRTRIPKPLLDGAKSITNYSLAQRMSWASGRLTTRIEDTAYCLFGLFDVNMPLLYGEGSKAFLRLQLEILNATEDFTLLAWTSKKTEYPNDPMTSLLASSPDDFARSQHVKGFDSSSLPYRQYPSEPHFERISVQATKTIVKLQCPVFGPLADSSSRSNKHEGTWGLTQALSAPQRQHVLKNSFACFSSPRASELTKRPTIGASPRSSRRSMALALVGQPDDDAPSESPYSDTYIGILIRFSPGRATAARRIHDPPLVLLDLTAAGRCDEHSLRPLASWPSSSIDCETAGYPEPPRPLPRIWFDVIVPNTFGVARPNLPISSHFSGHDGPVNAFGLYVDMQQRAPWLFSRSHRLASPAVLRCISSTTSDLPSFILCFGLYPKGEMVSLSRDVADYESQYYNKFIESHESRRRDLPPHGKSAIKLTERECVTITRYDARKDTRIVLDLESIPPKPLPGSGIFWIEP